MPKPTSFSSSDAERPHSSLYGDDADFEPHNDLGDDLAVDDFESSLETPRAIRLAAEAQEARRAKPEADEDTTESGKKPWEMAIAKPWARHVNFQRDSRAFPRQKRPVAYHQSPYYLTPATPEEHARLAQNAKSGWRFVGIDLAPNFQLETGIVALSREKSVIRQEKVNLDEQMVHFVKSLGPTAQTIVTIDVPKTLAVSSRWRQEEIKLFPLRLQRDTEDSSFMAHPDKDFTDRYSARAWGIFRQLTQLGAQVHMLYSALAKPRLGLQLPFRSRSSKGIMALQHAIESHLGISHGLPQGQQPPSSVLDAMVAGYASWLTHVGEPGTHWQVFHDCYDATALDILTMWRPAPQPKKRRFRRYKRLSG